MLESQQQHNQDDTDHAWFAQEQSEARRMDDELSNTLLDIAQCHKLLDADPEYQKWSGERAKESQEYQDNE